jgi:arylsulfatase A-like enzyme
MKSKTKRFEKKGTEFQEDSIFQGGKMKNPKNTFLIFLIPTISCGCAAGDPNRPNVIFILADDLGYGDLGCYGSPDIYTPNIDRIADQGARFTQCYAAGPVCTPTRCAFVTGRYPQRIGAMEWAIPPTQPWIGLSPVEPTITDSLHDRGYVNALIGKWHLGYTEMRSPNEHGFDTFFGLLGGNHNYFTHQNKDGQPDLYNNKIPDFRDGYTTDLITEHALAFIRENTSRPFFLYLAFNAPHWPYQGPADELVQVSQTLGNWSNGDRPTYVQMVERMDHGVGQVLDLLESAGLERNTIVFFTSDNGGDKLSRNEPLKDKKGTLWEGGIRVPGLVRWPGKVSAGFVSDQVAVTMDFSAMILAAAGATPSPHRSLDGVDLFPYLQPNTPVLSRTLFWRRKDGQGRVTQKAVRYDSWKYVRDGNADHLYDLAADVSETQNVAAAEPGRVHDMKKMLIDWEKTVRPIYAQSIRSPMSFYGPCFRIPAKGREWASSACGGQ